MSYGLIVKDGNGVETLGPSDFTLLSLGRFTVPEFIGNGTTGWLSGPTYTFDVPGYNDDDCYVIITPINYVGTPQTGSPNVNDRFLPTYKWEGGTTIGIYCYVNFFHNTNVGSGNYLPWWNARSAASNIEVVRFR